jgi:hypothetical protein
MKAPFPPWVVPLISFAAGAMDFCTGVLLIAAPEVTFRLMGLTAVSDPALVRFIGAFVAAVGALYLWALYRRKLRLAWEFTALVRSFIGCFVGLSVVLRTLEQGWVTVAITDFGLAGLQVYFLWKNWVYDE